MLLLTALLLFAFASHAAAQPPEARPSLAQLLAGVPVLSPEEQGIEQFSVSYEVINPEQGRLWGEVRWKRGAPPQLYVATDSQKIPVLLIADRQSMYFDLAGQRIVTLDQSAPHLQMRNKGHSVSYEFSIEPAAERLSRSDVLIDLTSFVQAKTDNQVLGQDANGNWRYQSTSPSGNSIQIVTFDRAVPHTVREIVISEIETGDIGLRIHDIRLNEQCNDKPWLRFPAVDEFPAGLSIVPVRRDRLNIGLQLAIGWNEMIDRLTLTHLAIDDKQRRVPPLSYSEEQWKGMERTKKQYGPQLRQLIGIRETPQ
ncbi:hypothetical protein C5Y96_11780 [Blastopirellula marina]|uniref:Uncharacterized protein n=2 Tax=Pirellulales TaxID=2691354 RepID=A0A2S8FFV1_9BACT|nr:hypothetical protein C5Y96_11780 [Blastopirellula marina]RCS51426.1 hypothetical protein DTL36_11790 [Bremerella cremea]